MNTPETTSEAPVDRKPETGDRHPRHLMEIMVERDPSLAKGTPTYFARKYLELPLYTWQENVLLDLFQGRWKDDLYISKKKPLGGWVRKQVALRAANGSGKTANCATPAVLFYASAFVSSQVVISSGVYRQVKEQLFGYIHDKKEVLGPDWELNATDFRSPMATRGVGFAASEPGKFEGFHKKGRPAGLLIVLDECKSIPDEIFQAVCRCQPTHLLAMSSPGEARGWFYDAFHKNKEFWHTHHVTAYDCPHLTEDWINEQIKIWGGLDNPFLRSMILADFTPEDGWYLFNSQYTELCARKPPAKKPGARACFVDWSGGGDETVISFVHGNDHEDMVTFREANTMAAVARIATEINARTNADLGITWVVGGDDGGLGKPMNDSLEQMLGTPVQRVNNSSSPENGSRYLNLVAEMWDMVAQRANKQELRLMDDPVLLEQLTRRKVMQTANGKIKLESKDDIKAAGGDSPDRADATIGAFFLAQKQDAMDNLAQTMSWNVLPEDQSEWQEYVMDGMHAGI